MSSLISIALLACWLGQAEPDSVAPEKKDAIEKAALQLGDKTQAVRETATQFLWNQGRQAEPALKQAAESSDRETSTRAKKILSDFDYGILPMVPAADVAILRQFRDGRLQERTPFLVELARKERFDFLANLINRETVVEERRKLLAALHHHEAAVTKILAAGQIEKLAERIGADQNEEWRSALIAQLYFSPEVLKQLIATKRADTILGFFKKKPTAATRDMMLNALASNPAVVSHFLRADQLATLLDLMRKVEDKARLSFWLAAILTNENQGEFAVLEKQRVRSILKFADENLDAAQRRELFRRMCQNVRFLDAWIAKRGVDGVVQETLGTLKGEERGTTLGTLLSSAAILKQWEAANTPYQWVNAAQNEIELTVRHSFLKQFVGASQFEFFQASGANNQRNEQFEKLWQLIRTDDDRDWQAEMVAGVAIRGNLRFERFYTPKDFAWLWEMLRGEATSERMQLRHWALSDAAFIKRSIENGSFDEMIKMVKAQTDGQRGVLFGAIMSEPQTLDFLRRTNRWEWIYALPRDEKMLHEITAEERHQYLEVVIANPSLVTAVFFVEKGEALIAEVKGLADKNLRAKLWPLLIRQREVLDQIAEKKQWGEVLTFMKDEPDVDAREAYLSGLLAQPNVVKALIEQKQLNMIFESLEGGGHKAWQLLTFARLIANPINAEPILNEKGAAKWVELFRDENIAEESREKAFELALRDEKCISIWVLQGYFETLNAWSKSKRDDQQVSMRIWRIFSNVAVWKQSIADGKLEVQLRPIFLAWDAQKRQSVLYMLLRDQQLVEMLLEAKKLDFLIALIGEMEPTEIRDSLWRMLLSMPAVTKRLAAEKNADLVLGWIKAQPEGNARNDFAEHLLKSHAVMKELLEKGAFNDLKALAEAAPDIVVRTKLMGGLLSHGSTNPAAKKAIQEGKLDTLFLTTIRDINDAHIRQACLLEVFSNGNLLNTLGARQHVEAMYLLMLDVPDASAKAQLATRFLAYGSHTDNPLLKTWLEVAWKLVLAHNPEKLEKPLVLWTLIQNQVGIGGLIERGHFDSLFEFIKKNGEIAHLAVFMQQPAVVRHVIEKSGAEGYMALLEKEFDLNQRRQIAVTLTFDSKTLSTLLEKGYFDKLWELARSNTNELANAQLQGRMLGALPTLKKLAETDRLSLLPETFRSFVDRNSRLQFILSLEQASEFGPAADKKYLDQATLEAMWKVVEKDSDPRSRDVLLRMMLRDEKGKKWLLQNEGIVTIIQAVLRSEPTFSRRRSFTQLVQDVDFIAAVDEAKKWSELADRCLLERDMPTRIALLADLISYPVPAARMEEANRFVEIFDIVAKYAIAGNDRQSGVTQLVWFRMTKNPAIMEIIKKRDRNELLSQAIQSLENATLRDQTAQSQRQPVPTVVIRRVPRQVAQAPAPERAPNQVIEPAPNRVPDPPVEGQNRLAIRLKNPDELAAWLRGHSHERILEIMDERDNEPAKRELLTNGIVIGHFVEGGKFKELVASLNQLPAAVWQANLVRGIAESPDARRLIVRDEVFAQVVSILRDNPSMNRAAACKALSLPQVRQTLISAGKFAELKSLFDVDATDQERKTQAADLLYSSTGLYGHHIARGDFDAAAELLKSRTSTEPERTRWVAFLLLTGRAAGQIKILEEQLTKTVSVDNQRLIMRLQRALGDDAAARETAKKLNYPDIRYKMLAEARLWNEAADEVTQLLNSDYVPPIKPGLWRIELVSLRAAFYRLAGKQEEAKEDLQQLTDLAAKSTDHYERWHVAKTLLLEGNVAEGLALLRRVDPPKAFELLVERHEITEALRAAGIEADTKLYRAWYDERLLALSRKGWTAGTKFAFGSRLAEVLRQVGRNDDSLQVLSLLETEIPVTDKTLRTASSSDPLMQAFMTLQGNKHERLTAKIMDGLLSPSQTMLIPYVLYKERDKAWLAYEVNSRAMFTPATISNSRRWKELSRMVAGNAKEEEIKPFLRQPIIDPTRKASTYWSVYVFQGRLHMTYNHLQEAKECFEMGAYSDVADPRDILTVLRKLEDWKEVARVAEGTWKANREHHFLPFMAADAWRRLGNKARADELVKEGSLSVLDSAARHRLAIELHRHGLFEDAERESELVLRTAPVDTVEWHDAQRVLGDMLVSRKPQKSLDHFDHFHLNNLRSGRQLQNPKDMLYMPLRSHFWQARLALEAGDVAKGKALIEQALTINPSAPWFAIEMLPVLEKAGLKDEATALFEGQWTRLAEACKEFPQAAMFHNDAAWLAAGCGRNLDEALKHAELAVKLDPKSAAYLDTLAEVHFRRQDRESALKSAQQALDLAPHDEKSKERLKHFETAPYPQAL